MAGPYNPPKNGEDLVVYVKLRDANNPGQFKSNPTIAAGDFKVTTDGGAEANLNTLPAVTPAGSEWVKVTVSAGEMSGHNVGVGWKDQTNPPEWDSDYFSILTTP